ncbi:glycosyltransferase family 4 protein [Pedobacter sp. Leaf250]|uniref:glycosyltransferase family 4 protein n=1 Tax=Pedobacter sp. Leaf250 TaxID=2876559 RepID=UPI001E3D7FB1|nr:glycosyltransferase family 4 protein [Pedobacter sp. Leaf250]
MRSEKILFLTLYTYSLTGGIEKVGQTIIEVFKELENAHKIKNHVTLSLHDLQNFIDHKGFRSNKFLYLLAVLKNAFTADTIILSHIHILPFAKLIRKLSPKKRIILFAHGIEVWKPLAKWKQEFLNGIEIWAVSNYTAEVLQKSNHVEHQNISVLNNSLSRNYSYSIKTNSEASLLDQYQIAAGEKLILTVCRLSSSEQYKGYDLVLLALKDVIKIYPNVKYIIAGKADDMERERVLQLIQDCKLEAHVTLIGYLDEDKLKELYQLADIFAMPSKGEGFGLVYLEAVANGCSVLAGNADGSKDALLNGKLGLLADPEDRDAIYQGLIQLLQQPITEDEIVRRQQMAEANFGFERYVEKVERLLASPSCITKINGS